MRRRGRNAVRAEFSFFTSGCMLFIGLRDDDGASRVATNR